MENKKRKNPFVNYGVIPFKHFNEVDKIIRQLKKEFENKVKYYVEDGHVYYENKFSPHERCL
ncbi:hypothetical protein D3C84_1289480 [compost metagenome]